MTTAQTEARAIDARAAEMRAGLEMATKGEWSVDGHNTAAIIFRQHGKTHVTDWMRLARCDDDNANWKADAAHIARCSPANISSLLDHVAALKDQVERLTRENAELEGARAEQWRLRREAESSRDVMSAVAATFRAERDAAQLAALKKEEGHADPEI